MTTQKESFEKLMIDTYWRQKRFLEALESDLEKLRDQLIETYGVDPESTPKPNTKGE